MGPNRRELLAGIAALTTAGAAGAATSDAIHGTLAPGLSAFPSEPAAPPKRKRLTVRQLMPEEVAERELLREAADRAQTELQAFHNALWARYSPGDGFDLNFEEDYVLIRDYRDEMADKKRAILRGIASAGNAALAGASRR